MLPVPLEEPGFSPSEELEEFPPPFEELKFSPSLLEELKFGFPELEDLVELEDLIELEDSWKMFALDELLEFEEINVPGFVVAELRFEPAPAIGARSSR